MLRIVSLLVPMYIVPAHDGQTPMKYGNKVIAKFEQGLSALTPFTVRQDADEAVIHPVHGLRYLRRVRYDVEARMSDNLASIISLALTTFDVPAISVIEGTRRELFDHEGVEAVATGLHEWCED